MIAEFSPEPPIRNHVALHKFTTLKVGGCAEWFLAPRSEAELLEGLLWARERDLPLTFIGAGSNLLVSDAGIPGLTICTRSLRGSRCDERTGRIIAAAGEPIPKLAWQAAERGWSGLEWAVGIPGTAGGLVAMNAGAQGGCAADVVLSARVANGYGHVQALPAALLEFAYRHSALQQGDRIVTEVVLQLEPGGDPQSVAERTASKLAHRHRTQPYQQPSCGSVFRNPPSQAAGWLIERAGLKGHQIGQARVSDLHANFIVNCGGATAADVYHLIHFVRDRVYHAWGVHLEPEVKFLGAFPPP